MAETPDEVAAQARYLDDGLLFLQEGKIIALLPWQEGEAFLHPLKGYVDLRGKLLLPGFVDAHVHYPQTEMIGAFGEQLLEWLTTYTFPVESQFADAEYAQEIAQFFVNQLISHGTTTALVFCTLHPASVEALFSEALRLNMRLIAGKVMMDRHVPDYLCETAGESYEQTRALIRRWHQRGRLGYAITPRFAPTSTPGLLEAVQRLRPSFPTPGCRRISVKTGRRSPGLNSCGLSMRAIWMSIITISSLANAASSAHGIHLDDAEWQCLHDTGVRSPPSAPTSNLFLGSGLFRLPACWQHQVRMGIGSDVGAGTTFSMLRDAGRGLQGRTTAELSPASQRGLLSRHPWRGARPAAGGENW
ncbi:Guanine deaminase [Klebsiella pneumoniae]|uniref:Guanine deaminase n=1 Tax=Klebsiella pneumoniae TaxID=573 RepID=A0A377W234_KLEPN|nr:Guanine deaminase [Klebsiella pneumoniae]